MTASLGSSCNNCCRCFRDVCELYLLFFLIVVRKKLNIKNLDVHERFEQHLRIITDFVPV